MSSHNHLDRQRRARGECPGCDVAWAGQDFRLTSGRVHKAIAQLDRMALRPPPELLSDFDHCEAQE